MNNNTSRPPQRPYTLPLFGDPEPDFETRLEAARRLHEAGRLEEAVAAYRPLLEVRPEHAPLLFLLGSAESARGQPRIGAGLLERSLALEPDHPDALNNLGNALKALGRHEDALRYYGQALELRPDYAEANYNLGDALAALRQPEQALARLRSAVALKPDYVKAYNAQGNVLMDLHRYEEALLAFDRACALLPDGISVLHNRSHALIGLGRLEEAMAQYDRALLLHPDQPETLFLKGLLYLLQGDYEPGWALYEARWRCSGLNLKPHPEPLWRGDSPLAGQTLLVSSNAGFGDTLQFCRFLPELATRGAHLIMEVPASLATLIRTLDCPMTLVTERDAFPHYDFCCPIMSLPRALRVTLPTLPARVPYLTPPSETRETWSRRLGPRRRFRVGLAWTGDPRHVNDRQRSVPLASLAPLFTLPVEFHSLQPACSAEDEPWLGRFRSLHTHHDAIRDFTDTAALISHLDLVICVDTAVAHLAGALGYPAWVLLPDMADFRWLRDRSDSPWYPTLTLFRQIRPGDWESVVQAVRHGLAERLLTPVRPA